MKVISARPIFHNVLDRINQVFYTYHYFVLFISHQGVSIDKSYSLSMPRRSHLSSGT
jgi:hypothetical protein